MLTAMPLFGCGGGSRPFLETDFLDNPPCMCRVMAEVMLEEIGRRPGAAAQGEDGGQPHGAGLHKVRACLLT